MGAPRVQGRFQSFRDAPWILEGPRLALADDAAAVQAGDARGQADQAVVGGFGVRAQGNLAPALEPALELPLGGDAGRGDLVMDGLGELPHVLVVRADLDGQSPLAGLREQLVRLETSADLVPEADCLVSVGNEDELLEPWTPERTIGGERDARIGEPVALRSYLGSTGETGEFDLTAVPA